MFDLEQYWSGDNKWRRIDKLRPLYYFYKPFILPILAVLAMLIILPLGLTMLYSSSNPSKDLISQTSNVDKNAANIPTTLTPTMFDLAPTASVNTPDTWKTIINNRCGISMKHPPDWLVINREGTGTMKEIWDGCRIMIKSPNSQYVSFAINDMAPPNKSFGEYENDIKNISDEEKKVGLKLVTISLGGREFPAQLNSVEPTQTNILFYAFNRNTVLSGVGMYDATHPTDKEIFDGMVASVKFF